MSLVRIASRYAKSLIDLALERNNLAKVVSDMTDFKETLKNRELLLVFKSPIIDAGKKTSIVNSIYASSMDELSLEFIKLVIKKGREALLPEIADEVIAQYKRMQQITSVTVTSAVALDEATLDQVKAKMAQFGYKTEKLEIITKINPSIIGGYILQIGDQMYDASVLGSFEKLRKELA